MVDKVKYLAETAHVSTATAAPPQDDVAAVRAFNRFYTRWVGALDQEFLETEHSLPEARVLFELGRRRATEVADLRAALDLDPGYLSRLLARLEAEGLVARERSTEDARRQVARLTRSGRSAFRILDRRSGTRIGAALEDLGAAERARLVAAMRTVNRILEPPQAEAQVAYRAPAAGDFGWIAERHGVLYAEEFGWDATFEGLVARIVGDFATGHDPEREAAWIATVDGERAGSVLCVEKDARTAQLRLLLVEPWARGRGVGAGLVGECLGFARRAGYREITLWTNDVLESARRIYEGAGFALVDSKPHRSFGRDLVGQNWSLALA
jgi:DNA-binding MarR family transcriptional regulator/GNAT superfamily N-acetyltransferase